MRVGIQGRGAKDEHVPAYVEASAGCIWLIEEILKLEFFVMNGNLFLFDSHWPRP